jgi:hypothetical protein
MYDLAKALRIRVLQPGLLMAKRVKTERKGVNITTILRNFLNKITEEKQSLSLTHVAVASSGGGPTAHA